MRNKVARKLRLFFSDIGKVKRALLVEFFDSMTVQELNRFLARLRGEFYDTKQ